MRTCDSRRAQGRRGGREEIDDRQPVFSTTTTAAVAAAMEALSASLRGDEWERGDSGWVGGFCIFTAWSNGFGSGKKPDAVDYRHHGGTIWEETLYNDRLEGRCGLLSCNTLVLSSLPLVVGLVLIYLLE